MVAVANKQGQLVFAEARGDRAIGGLVEALRHCCHQVVGSIQADHVEQLGVVVRLDQQQAMRPPLRSGFANRSVECAEEGGAVEQPSRLVALLEFLDLTREFWILVRRLAAKDHLLARLAFVLGGGEFHHRGKIAAFDVARGQFIARRRRIAFGQALQQLLEFVHVLRRHQVEQRHALDVLELLVAEHLQVGRIGADVHAFVDVGNRLPRGIDQRVAAALRFAHLRFKLALRAPRDQIFPSSADRTQQLLRASTQGDPVRAERLQRIQGFIGDPVQHGQQGDVATATADHHAHLVERQAAAGVFGQHQIDLLLGQLAGQLVQRFGTQRTHRNAGVAQAADDGLGLIDLVVDQHQSQCSVLTDGHAGWGSLELGGMQ